MCQTHLFYYVSSFKKMAVPGVAQRLIERRLARSAGIEPAAFRFEV